LEFKVEVQGLGLGVHLVLVPQNYLVTHVTLVIDGESTMITNHQVPILSPHARGQKLFKSNQIKSQSLTGP
jgi:hypothetical protein